MRYVYFLSDDPLPYLTTLTSEQRKVATAGWTDKNHQTIAVTLRLRFAVRVNYAQMLDNTEECVSPTTPT
jgi:hypothetical protein